MVFRCVCLFKTRFARVDTPGNLASTFRQDVFEVEGSVNLHELYMKRSENVRNLRERRRDVQKEFLKARR